MMTIMETVVSVLMTYRRAAVGFAFVDSEGDSKIGTCRVEGREILEKGWIRGRIRAERECNVGRKGEKEGRQSTWPRMNRRGVPGV
jgi:hypothetical protein